MRFAVLMSLLAACQGDGTPVDDTDLPVDDTDVGGDDTDGPGRPVRVNEIMASNTAALERDDGEFPDWVELVNLTDAAVDLGGASITDDLGEPGKHVLPLGLMVPARGYLIVWFDDVGGRADAVPSKLSASGESVGLYAEDGTAWDEVDFGEQTTDVSWARSPDGTGPFAPDDTPTPGAANE